MNGSDGPNCYVSLLIFCSHVSEKAVTSDNSVSDFAVSLPFLFRCRILVFLLQIKCEQSSMDGEAIPTEGFAVQREGSREATGGSDDSGKSDCQTLFLRKKWTDENHNLYLNSMESSFINQLYNNENASSDLLDFLLSVTPKPTKKLVSTSNFCHFSCQFEFPGTSSHNFARKRTQFEMKNATRQLFENPWIRHFTPRGTLNQVDSNELINRAMPSRNTSTNQKQADSSHMPRQHYAGNIAEVSDQNFDDIDPEGQSEERVAKRKKSPTVEPLVNDSSTKDVFVALTPMKIILF